MEPEKFLELEYQTLREEIAQNRDHRFKIAGFGFIGLPSAYYLAHASNALQHFQIWVLSLPMLVGVIALLYIAKSRAIMRCGTYIKAKIESHIKQNSESKIGWEHWLSDNEPTGDQDRRIVDKLFAISFYLLLSIYYLASTYLAGLTAKAGGGIAGLAMTWGVYGGIAIIAVRFLVKHYVMRLLLKRDNQHLTRRSTGARRTKRLHFIGFRGAAPG